MEMQKVTSNIKLEGAKIIIRNFQGKKKEFNEEGNRNFGVIIDDELADQLIEDGDLMIRSSIVSLGSLSR